MNESPQPQCPPAHSLMIDILTTVERHRGGGWIAPVLLSLFCRRVEERVMRRHPSFPSSLTHSLLHARTYSNHLRYRTATTYAASGFNISIGPTTQMQPSDPTCGLYHGYICGLSSNTVRSLVFVVAHIVPGQEKFSKCVSIKFDGIHG